MRCSAGLSGPQSVPQRVALSPVGVARAFQARVAAALKGPPYKRSDDAGDRWLHVGLAGAVGRVGADFAIEQDVRAHPEHAVARSMAVAERGPRWQSNRRSSVAD